MPWAPGSPGRPGSPSAPWQANAARTEIAANAANACLDLILNLILNGNLPVGVFKLYTHCW